MNTFLSTEQETARADYEKFATEHVGANAEALEADHDLKREVLQSMAQKGYLGISVPRDMGGQGLPFLNAILFTEAVSAHDPGLALSLAGHYATIEVLKKYGSQTQKSRYLPSLARGELTATLLFSEPQAGTDVFAASTAAVASGGGFQLTGKKTWVVDASTAQAWLTLAKDEKGFSVLALVDGQSGKATISPDKKRMGLRSARAQDVDLNGVEVTADQMFTGDCQQTVEFAMDVAKVVLAAGATGLLSSALDHAVKHARERQQFGVSIGQFQGIQWKLADMYAELTGARLILLKAATSLEEAPEEFARNAAMCKWFAARAARVHTGEAIQVMGASGLLEDLPLERFYRDAKAMEICLGTSEAQKVQLVKELQI